MVNSATVVTPIQSAYGLSRLARSPANSRCSLSGMPRTMLPIATPKRKLASRLPAQKLTSQSCRHQRIGCLLRNSIATARKMRANTQYQERPGLPRADDGVRQALHAGGIEEHRPKVGDLSAHRVAVAHQVIAGRGLLPGVRHDNPDRAEMSAERDHKGRQEMGLWLYLVPAEQEHGQKTGFEEESEDALRRQRAA